VVSEKSWKATSVGERSEKFVFCSFVIAITDILGDRIRRFHTAVLLCGSDGLSHCMKI